MGVFEYKQFHLWKYKTTEAQETIVNVTVVYSFLFIKLPGFKGGIILEIKRTDPLLTRKAAEEMTQN